MTDPAVEVENTVPISTEERSASAGTFGTVVDDHMVVVVVAAWEVSPPTRPVIPATTADAAARKATARRRVPGRGEGRAAAEGGAAVPVRGRGARTGMQIS
ncbi:hypothetical protein GCM10009714_00140 [Microlunatus capsulatus]